MIGLISLLKEIQGKPKAIFMAGPAGSGKSFISQKLVPSNFNTINVDDTYEELLKSSGIGMKLANMSPDELKKSERFKMATDGMDELNFTPKQTWEMLYRKWIDILPNEIPRQEIYNKFMKRQ